MAALLEAVKVGESSLSLCWQLEGHPSNKSSMCSFQVTSRSENVYMMAALMGQSSSEKRTHTHTFLLVPYTHTLHRSTLAWERVVEEMNDGPNSCLGVMV